MAKERNVVSLRGGSGRVGPTDVMERRIGALAREWWESEGRELLDQVSLGEALQDVGMLALGHLARRLTSPDTPDRLKDRIALAMGPKLGVELRTRGRPRSDGGRAVDHVLAAYVKAG